MTSVQCLLRSRKDYVETSILNSVPYPNTSYSSALQFVGTLDMKHIRRMLNTNIRNGNVYVHDGIVEHIDYHHKNVYRMFETDIRKMIECPDFVGANPKESDSVELYIEKSHLLLAIKSNRKAGYLYLASLFRLDDWNRKIPERLENRRIRRFNYF